MKHYDRKDHTFVVCAYQKSKYLEECIFSLLNQTVKTNVIIATSTPNEYITGIAEKYQLPVFVNSGEKGIAGDWNFAISCANTPLVTLAHQDDIYDKDYVRMMLAALRYCEHPLIGFCDYNEIRNGKTITQSQLLKVKRLMLLPLRLRCLWSSRMIRRRILALGNAICCPSVTFVLDNLKRPIFINNMKSNIDWQAWEEISRQKGEFAYVPVAVMKHRIHEESTTSELLEVNGRCKEDLYMFCKFWPKFIAKVINGIYHSNEKSNKIE